MVRRAREATSAVVAACPQRAQRPDPDSGGGVPPARPRQPPRPSGHQRRQGGGVERHHGSLPHELQLHVHGHGPVLARGAHLGHRPLEVLEGPLEHPHRVPGAEGQVHHGLARGPRQLVPQVRLVLRGEGAAHDGVQHREVVALLPLLSFRLEGGRLRLGLRGRRPAGPGPRCGGGVLLGVGSSRGLGGGLVRRLARRRARCL
mmetsp:Transcript_4572/g.15171  ORF Transcript_4572/g.15171 Transcript_4572/m.15171 type:complete len:203 (-) Transcript_4572:833-1441(-)